MELETKVPINASTQSTYRNFPVLRFSHGSDWVGQPRLGQLGVPAGIKAGCFSLPIEFSNDRRATLLELAGVLDRVRAGGGFQWLGVHRHSRSWNVWPSRNRCQVTLRLVDFSVARLGRKRLALSSEPTNHRVVSREGTFRLRAEHFL